MTIKDTNVRITVTMPISIHNELKEISDQEIRSVSNLILKIIKVYLRSLKRSKSKKNSLDKE